MRRGSGGFGDRLVVFAAAFVLCLSALTGGCGHKEAQVAAKPKPTPQPSAKELAEKAKAEKETRRLEKEFQAMEAKIAREVKAAEGKAQEGEAEETHRWDESYQKQRQAVNNQMVERMQSLNADQAFESAHQGFLASVDKFNMILMKDPQKLGASIAYMQMTQACERMRSILPGCSPTMRRIYEGTLAEAKQTCTEALMKISPKFTGLEAVDA